MTTVFSFFMMAMLALTSTAQAECVSAAVSAGNVQIQRGMFNDHTCFVSISPDPAADMSFRSYIIADDGSMLVFNSYGEGPVSTYTGAREFYFFPRLNIVDFGVDPRSRDISVFTANSDEFIFDSRTGQLKSMGHGRAVVDPKVSRNNAGGVEVTNYRGLYLDVGFAMGEDPATIPGANAIFHSPEGSSCSLKVKDIFEIVHGDPKIQFSDRDLNLYLQNHCSPWNLR